MNNQTLPLPNPGDWLTINGAHLLLGVSRRTVERMVTDGRLTGYYPEGSPDRVASALLWRADVETLAAAIARTRRPHG